MVDNLLVTDLNFRLGVWLDGEDSCAEEASAYELDEARVFLTADDVFVYFACLLRREDFALDHFAVEGHLEIGNVRAFGYGEDIGGFEPPVGGIFEGLVDSGEGDAVVDCCGYEVIDDAEGLGLGVAAAS